MTIFRESVSALIALFLTVPVLAQTRARPAPGQTFDVVSVKVNQSGGQTNINVMPTGVTLTNIALRPVIQLAYGVTQASRLAGGPSWITTDRFDIVARGDTGSRDDMRIMLQTLLADRFKLVTHIEQRPLDVYELVLARRDGTLGPSIKPSAIDCVGEIEAGRGPGSTAAQAAGGHGRCAPQTGGPGHMILVGSRLSRLAGLLAMNVGRTVVDKTGLAGAYDIELRQAPNQPNAVNEDLPSIFTAVQEQLGLTLKPATEPQDVLVIDRVERPEPN